MIAFRNFAFQCSEVLHLLHGFPNGLLSSGIFSVVPLFQSTNVSRSMCNFQHFLLINLIAKDQV